MVRPAGKRAVVSHLVSARGLSEHRTCRLANLNLSTWQYRPRGREPSRLCERLKELAGEPVARQSASACAAAPGGPGGQTPSVHPLAFTRLLTLDLFDRLHDPLPHQVGASALLLEDGVRVHGGFDCGVFAVLARQLEQEHCDHCDYDDPANSGEAILVPHAQV